MIHFVILVQELFFLNYYMTPIYIFILVFFFSILI